MHEKEKDSCLAKDGWPMLNSRYIPLEIIGKGGYAEVYKAFDIKSMKNVALKINLQVRDSAYESVIKHLSREIKTHKKLDHPNIVRVLDNFEMDKTGEMVIVMEYCSGPELRSYFRKQTCLP